MARAVRTRPTAGRVVGSRVARAARALVSPPPRRALEPPPAPPAVPDDLVPLLRELGAALLSSGQSVVDIEEALDVIAQAYGAAQVRTLVFPTGVFIRVETADGGRSDFTGPRSADNLPLHQIGDVDRLVADLAAHRVELPEARARLRDALSMPPRFGPLVQVLGHALLTLGFGLVLYPVPAAIPVYLGVGAAIGVLRALAGRWPTLGTALPVVASFLVGVLAITWFAPLVGGDTVRLLAPPLVSFLPGAVLTVAAMELTSGQVVAGASRLVYGLAQLLLLAFGIVAAVTVAGPLTSQHDVTTLGRGAAWAGVLLVAVGHRFFSSPPRGTFWWLLLALYAAYAAQALGAVLLSPQLSGFLGGLAIVPVAQVIAGRRSGPPAVVTMLPAFWLLVPGALGFRSISEIAVGASLGVDDLVATALSLFSIALGVLVGTALTRDVRYVGRAVLRVAQPGAPGGSADALPPGASPGPGAGSGSAARPGRGSAARPGAPEPPAVATEIPVVSPRTGPLSVAPLVPGDGASPDAS